MNAAGPRRVRVAGGGRFLAPGTAGRALVSITQTGIACGGEPCTGDMALPSWYGNEAPEPMQDCSPWPILLPVLCLALF